jgi:hypothetical protein
MPRPIPAPNWTNEDSRRAMSEGWDLFRCDDGTLQLQRLDEMTEFDSDREAREYVVIRSASSSFHAKALQVEVDHMVQVHIHG